MKRVFFGRVIPERADVSLSHPITLTDPDPLGFCITISILKSQIHATCSWDDSVNLLTFKNQLEFQARLVVDILGARERCGYDIEIISALDPETGLHDVFGVEEDIQVNNDFPEFSKMVEKAGLEPALYVALANFREAIRVPHETSLHCYRAIEAIRQTFVPQGADKDSRAGRNASWLAMRRALNLLETTLREPEDLATSLRHGEVVGQPWLVRKRHLEISHEIIRRFLHLRVGEKAHLGQDFAEY